MNLFSLTLILFLIMDPIGNVAYFLRALQGVPVERRTWVILREMLIALVAILAFNFLGEWIFAALKVSTTSVMLSSGLILFLTAIKILFPTTDSMRTRVTAEEPFVIPLAIPLIAGPSMLATTMLFANLETQAMMFPAILIAWAVSTAILLLGPRLQRLMSNNGLLAIEKLLGMVLVMLAIQRFGEGMREFIHTYVFAAH